MTAGGYVFIGNELTFKSGFFIILWEALARARTCCCEKPEWKLRKTAVVLKESKPSF